MDGVDGVVCLSLCTYSSNVRVCGFRNIVLSGTYCWSLVRIIDLGGCGWKLVAL